MAPKKKKTQLKPIVRGFATISVPKKAVEPPKDPETSPDLKDNPSTKSNGHSTDAVVTPQAANGASVPALSTTDQTMQNFIDKFQDKVEKEIVRTVKASLLVCVFGLSVDAYARLYIRRGVSRIPSSVLTWIQLSLIASLNLHWSTIALSVC